MIVFFHLLLYFDEKDEFKILKLTVRTEIALIIVTETLPVGENAQI
jgi:hypothetical protein